MFGAGGTFVVDAPQGIAHRRRLTCTAMTTAAFAMDERAEWESFSRELPARRGSWESYIAIEGMHCPACSLVVEQVVGTAPGVTGVQVNGATGTARVVWSPDEGRPSQWVEALAKAGYGAMPAADALASAPRRREQRMLLWRWLVAGFCMMQVMMYAVPAYVAAPGEITPDIDGLLRWASWLMTLPVLLFSCAPFFCAAWRDLRRARIGMDVPVAIGLIVAFGASTVGTFDAQSVLARDTWFDSITMFVFFLLSGRLLEQRLRDRTAGALEALGRRMPETVERENAPGVFERVPVRRLAAGDRIRVLPGEAVPADGEIASGASSFDEALLTGESAPVARGEGARVVAGSHNMSSAVVVKVTRCGADTRFAEIVALMERASAEKPRAAQLADRIASPFLFAVIVASAAVAAWWWPTDPSHAIALVVAVLIVTCPCALSLATPAATLAAAGALARQGIFVRRVSAIEACAAIDTVIFDKTGTLTCGDLAITAIRTRAGLDERTALSLAAGLARHSLHPASRAIVAAAAGQGAQVSSNAIEVPGCGISAQVAGYGTLRLGSAAFCGVPPGDVSAVHLADEQGWLASFEFEEALRPEACAAVHSLGRLAIAMRLLSGDQREAVRRIAGAVGIADSAGQCTPETKLAQVRQLQARGHRVAMVGDGMNDGPVLARADVSIAVGQAVPLAQAKSDFIVPGGRLDAVPLIVRQARRTRTVVRENLAWAAAYNAVCVPLAVLGWMPPWLAGLGMAASSLLVVLNSARLARLPGHR
jgi:Cu2+-exporting ATPase